MVSNILAIDRNNSIDSNRDLSMYLLFFLQLFILQLTFLHVADSFLMHQLCPFIFERLQSDLILKLREFVITLHLQLAISIKSIDYCKDGLVKII